MIRFSEYVSLGHPDKTADYISQYLLDRYIERDPAVRYAVEVQIKGTQVTLGGEVTSGVSFTPAQITAFVRKAVCEIGYTRAYQRRWGAESTICGKDVVGGVRGLDAFRKPFIKKRLIMYMPFPHLQQALNSGEIHIHRDADTGEIIGYLWLKDLKKKPVSKIEEIVSVRHGLGSEMIDWAKQHARHPVIELKVVDYNTAAIDFYQKRGFREVSRETGKKINNITMQYKRT